MSPGRDGMSFRGMTLLNVIGTLANAAFPRRVTVRRSVWIARPASRVWPLIASFKEGWPNWSPYGAQRDPTIRFEYEGPVVGIGALQRWTAEHMGVGQMLMVHADPDAGVRYTIALVVAGMSIEGDASIDLAPEGDGCTVTWTSTMDLSASRIARTLSAIVGRGMGQAFDEGLAALKREAEREPAARAA